LKTTEKLQDFEYYEIIFQKLSIQYLQDERNSDLKLFNKALQYRNYKKLLNYKIYK